jgi:hypothetical protein
MFSAPDTLVPGRIEHDLRLATGPVIWTVDGSAVRTSAVARSAIEGLIVSASTGEGLPSVQVTVENTNRGAITDAAGRFRLTGLPIRDVVLEARGLGLTRARVRLDLSSDSGHAVVLPLAPARVEMCAGAVGNQSSASVTARIIDARTGKAPRGSEVRVRITDGDYRQEQSATAVSDSLSIDVGPWRMGVYDVVIVAPSYAPWHVRNVIVGVDHCNSAQAALVRAFLLPAGRVLAP